MSAPYRFHRPHTIVVLAMSIDGKIADVRRAPARFGSQQDKNHLETQIAQVDAVLFGAGTLRAYGSTLQITNTLLLQKRQQAGKPPQPIQIVCSQSARFDPALRFFRQSVPRWLLTERAVSPSPPDLPFERIVTFQTQTNRSDQPDQIDWSATLHQFLELGIEQLMVSGGGTLIAALLAADLIDEIWLTLCPLILGGSTAPTPVEGAGFLEAQAPRWTLLSVETVDQEVFLHYGRGQ
jgi:5-amino-6-(5-phosphoribosylamino)uracil reductase